MPMTDAHDQLAKEREAVEKVSGRLRGYRTRQENADWDAALDALIERAKLVGRVIEAGNHVCDWSGKALKEDQPECRNGNSFACPAHQQLAEARAALAAQGGGEA